MPTDTALQKFQNILSRTEYLTSGSHLQTRPLQLQETGVKIPILVFFDRDHIKECFEYDLTPVVFDLNTAKSLSREAVRRKSNIAIHIKVDTGMGRLGFTLDKASAEIYKIAGLENIRLEGLMSHFSDADLQDKEFANLQLRKFLSLRKELRQNGITFNYFHMANSAAVLTMPGAHLNMVRPGIMLYGYGR